MFTKTNIVLAASVLLVSGSMAHSALVAEWNFNSLVGGTTLTDQVGTINGTASAGVSVVPSGAGAEGSVFDFLNAYSFLGNSNSVSVSLGSTSSTGAISNFGTGAFSIAGWFDANERNSNGNYRTIFSNIGATGGFSINLGGSVASNRGKFQAQVGAGAGAVTYQSTLQYDRTSSEQQWHWFAVTSDGSVMSVYIDGSLMASLNYLAGTTATPDAGSQAFIGRAFDGSVDQLTVWNEQLTGVLDGTTLASGQLYDLWQQGVPVPEPGVVGLSLLGGGMIAFSMLRGRFKKRLNASA